MRDNNSDTGLFKISVLMRLIICTHQTQFQKSYIFYFIKVFVGGYFCKLVSSRASYIQGVPTFSLKVTLVMSAKNKDGNLKVEEF